MLRPAALVIVTANLCYGGTGRDPAGAGRLAATLEVLEGTGAGVVLLQEVDAGGDPCQLHRHLWGIAGDLGMVPVLGPSAAIRSETGNHTAILVDTSAGLRVTDQWPPPAPAGPRVPWCRAEITVPGLDGPLQACSVHLSARSPSARVHAAELIASYAAQHARVGQVIAAGDWNDYPRLPAPGADELDALPGHARVSRCRPGPGGTWVPRHDVDDLLTTAGLVDLAARHDPAALAATTPDGARADRVYATPGLAATLTSCRVLPIGSDHRAVTATFGLARGPTPAGLTA